MNKKLGISLLTMFLLIIFAIGIVYKFVFKPVHWTDEVERTKTTTTEIYSELGLTMSLPKGYVINTITEVNDLEEPYLYTMYIQDYGLDGKPPENYLQIYGIYQTDIGNTTEDFLNTAKTEFVEGTVEEFEIDGKPAVGGILQGSRGNYSVIFIYKEKLFRISVSKPTEENIAKAKGIIKTFKFSN